jgi:hypothetical protein
LDIHSNDDYHWGGIDLGSFWFNSSMTHKQKAVKKIIDDVINNSMLTDADKIASLKPCVPMIRRKMKVAYSNLNKGNLKQDEFNGKIIHYTFMLETLFDAITQLEGKEIKKTQHANVEFLDSIAELM